MSEFEPESSSNTLPGGSRPTRVRYFVMAFLATAAMNAYLTRGMGVVNTTLQEDLKFSESDVGHIIAGFALGYFWFQIPSGWLANRYGARLVFPIITILGSTCELWTSLSVSGTSLWASRLVLGFAQAGLVPVSALVLTRWIPVHRRGFASSFMGASMSIGGIFATGLTANLLPYVSWRWIFAAYSIVGIVWAIAFYGLFRDFPEEHPATNRAERDLIHAGPVAKATANRESASPAGLLSQPIWWLFLTSLSLWGVCIQAFFRAFSYEFFPTWFPAYLEKAYQMTKVEAGSWTTLPLACVVGGSMIGGFIVDWLLVKTGSKWISRSVTGATTMSLCALCTLSATFVHNPIVAVSLISLGSFFAGMAGPCAWTVTIDIGGKRTAIIFGIMNMVGNIGSFACPEILGYLFEYIQNGYGGWNLVLYLFVGINLACGLFFLITNPNREAAADVASPLPAVD